MSINKKEAFSWWSLELELIEKNSRLQAIRDSIDKKEKEKVTSYELLKKMHEWKIKATDDEITKQEINYWMISIDKENLTAIKEQMEVTIINILEMKKEVNLNKYYEVLETKQRAADEVAAAKKRFLDAEEKYRKALENLEKIEKWQEKLVYDIQLLKLWQKTKKWEVKKWTTLAKDSIFSGEIPAWYKKTITNENEV